MRRREPEASAAARLAVVAVALLLAAASFAALWPGYALYDSVGQFRQALAGQYEDWHPPVMAWLWSGLHRAFGGTGGPLLALQLGLYWLGFGLLAEALVYARKNVAAGAVLLLGCSPLLLGWQAAILKDSQLLGALLAAFGLIASARLRDRRLTVLFTVPLIPLFGYALLVRSNAVFAVIPLLVFLSPRPIGLVGKLIAIAFLSLAVIAAEPFVNHRLLGASASGVEKTQPLYDLAAIGISDPKGSPFTPAELARIKEKACVKPFFWDPLGDEIACGSTVERLQSEAPATLYRLWANAIVAHPLAYARHRLAHWNSTERWLIPPGRIGAEPPATSEPNPYGLAAPTSALARAIHAAGAAEAGTPLGWPMFWTFLAIVAAPFAWARRNEPAASLALALAASAIGLEASFLLVSIASDLRYHLWAMTASALALILLADGFTVSRGRAGLLLLALAALVAAGLNSRAKLPTAPATYRAMIDTP